jgi:hypothetical protein
MVSKILGDCITTGVEGSLMKLTAKVDAAIEWASLPISSRCFGRVLRRAAGNPVDEALDDLAVAAASNGLECSLLEVAVGSGSVEMTKCLLEFRSARATRETLKQSISSGNPELIKLMRERLPEAELRDRVDLQEVAAEFHQEEVLAWLFRDATVFDLELLGAFALEWKLADSLMVALHGGFRPWWNRTRDVSLKWRASAQMEFVSAPEGFFSDGGWWTDVSGATTVLPGPGWGGEGGQAGPNHVRRVHSVSKGEWTKAMS